MIDFLASDCLNLTLNSFFMESHKAEIENILQGEDLRVHTSVPNTKLLLVLTIEDTRLGLGVVLGGLKDPEYQQLLRYSPEKIASPEWRETQLEVHREVLAVLEQVRDEQFSQASASVDLEMKFTKLFDLLPAGMRSFYEFMLSLWMKWRYFRNRKEVDIKSSVKKRSMEIERDLAVMERISGELQACADQIDEEEALHGVISDMALALRRIRESSMNKRSAQLRFAETLGGESLE